MASEETEIALALEQGAIEGGFGPARRIETHLSYVFLAGDRAIKLKRRVRLPFVDLRTIEQRRATLQAEIIINRRTAPALYIDLLPVTRGARGLALGGDGAVIDWVLIMRRFADEALFDTMAREGRLSVELIEATAETIAKFHRSLVPAEQRADADYYAGIIAELRETEAEGAAKHGIKPSSDALFDALGHALEAHRSLIEARAARGHVRHGHGDLHLRNICLFDGQPTLFDALEFDVDLATCDTLYDVAFLLMDLRHRGLSAHANAAMNRYWDAAGEAEEALTALSFFMALRATVRIAVLTEDGKIEEAEVYRRLALDLLAPISPRFIAVGGLSGTGKSVLARALAPELPGACGARLLRSDVVRKQIAGVETKARLEPAAYTPEQRMAVYRVLAERASAALEATSVIADATFREAETRALIENAARARGFTGLWLDAPREVRIARAGAREADASDATAAIAAAQSAPEALSPAWRRIDAARPLEEVLADARAQGARRA